MAGGSTNAVILKHIHTLYHAGAMGGLTDGQLLKRLRGRARWDCRGWLSPP